MIDYLDDEELQSVEVFEQALEDGTLVSAPDFESRKKVLQKVARNTLNKTRNINIRLTERDLHRLKTKAIEEGIPYQTLAASIYGNARFILCFHILEHNDIHPENTFLF